VEGNSIRATSRMTAVSKDTVVKLQVEAGFAAAEYQDNAFQNLTCKRMQCDEIWAFCYAKEKNVTPKIAAKYPGAGDIWTWAAIDADTKLIPSFGNRNAATARQLTEDLAGRLKNRIQLTTDGLRVYIGAVESALGSEIDYAMLSKIYELSQEETRYNPAKCVGPKHGQSRAAPTKIIFRQATSNARTYQCVWALGASLG